MKNENKKTRLKTYYFIADDWGGQRGCFIEEVKLTKAEYRELTARGRAMIGGRYGFLTDTYASALYYIQD